MPPGVGEVGFYHLTRQRLEAALPVLLERVLERGLRAVLVAREVSLLEQLDGVLWTYKTDSFLAHGTAATGFAERQPIYLTPTVENPNGATVLVVVDGLLPAQEAPFKRVVDLFDGGDAAAVEAARDRWRAWRERPATKLVYWQQRPEGGWTKAREEEVATT